MKKTYKPNEHTTITVEARKPKFHELVIIGAVITAVVAYFKWF